MLAKTGFLQRGSGGRRIIPARALASPPSTPRSPAAAPLLHNRRTLSTTITAATAGKTPASTSSDVVAQLSTVIYDTIRSEKGGVEKTEILHRIDQAFGTSKASPSAAVKFSDKEKSWYAASTSFYVQKGRYYPISWADLLTAVASTIPYEGVTEKVLLERLRRQFFTTFPTAAEFSMPTVEPAATTEGPSPLPPSRHFANWMLSHFSHLVMISRSATQASGSDCCYLYYAANRPNVLQPLYVPAPSEVARGDADFEKDVRDVEDRQILEKVSSALRLLRRDRLPLWTSCSDLHSVLQTQQTAAKSDGNGGLAKLSTVTDWYQRFTSSSVLRERFDIKPTVLVVEAAPATATTDSSSSNVYTESASSSQVWLMVDALSVGLSSTKPSLLDLAEAAVACSKLYTSQPAPVAFITPRGGSEEEHEGSLLGTEGLAQTVYTYSREVELCQERLAKQLGEAVLKCLTPGAASSQEEGQLLHVIPVDDAMMIESHHAIGAALERLEAGESPSPYQVGSVSLPSTLILLCGDEVLEPIRRAVSDVWAGSAAAGSRVERIIIFTPKHIATPVTLTSLPHHHE